jgi:hypothetical protein
MVYTLFYYNTSNNNHLFYNTIITCYSSLVIRDTDKNHLA